MAFNFRSSVTPTPSTTVGALGDISKDAQLSSPPDDSISALSWSPTANYLAVASWDNKVRIYDVTRTSSGEGRAIIDFGGPVLSCDWSKDGQKVIGAGADKTARLLDLGSGASAQQVAAHEEPIRSVRFFEAPNTNAPMVVTGSWDKTIKYWDLRQSTPVGSLTCEERVYSMDVKGKLLVIATADRHLQVVDLNNPTTFFRSIPSPLKHQTRVVSCFIDSSGFALGGIEGRCGCQYVAEKDQNRNFSFRCHRDQPVNNNVNVHTINAISIHPINSGILSTAGSDGTFHFWDITAHQRLKGFPEVGGSISATGFNRDGTIFAYAVSYDWSKGYSYNTPQHANKIMFHRVTAEECTPKPSTKRR